MPDTIEKKSPFSNVKPKKNTLDDNKKFWDKRKNAKKEAEKIQKFKKNNPATLNQPFDGQS